MVSLVITPSRSTVHCVLDRLWTDGCDFDVAVPACVPAGRQRHFPVPETTRALLFRFPCRACRWLALLAASASDFRAGRGSYCTAPVNPAEKVDMTPWPCSIILDATLNSFSDRKRAPKSLVLWVSLAMCCLSPAPWGLVLLVACYRDKIPPL